MKFVEFADNDGPVYIDPILVTEIFVYKAPNKEGSKIRVKTPPITPYLTTPAREAVRIIEEWYGHKVFVEFADEDGPVFIRPEFVAGVFVSSEGMTVMCSSVYKTTIHVNNPIAEVMQVLEGFELPKPSFAVSSDS